MKTLKNIMAFLIVGLFFVACDNEKKSSYSLLYEAKFLSPRNNIYYSSGMQIPVKLAFDSTKVKSYSLYINDSLIVEKEFGGQFDSYPLDSKKMQFGTQRLRLEALMQDGQVVKDNRSVQILSNQEPKRLEAIVINDFPHAIESYTQGLEFYKGELYEGAGQYENSKLLKVNLVDGSILREKSIEDKFFGEGITVFNGVVYQLTWRENTCISYNINTFEELNRFSYVGEGWGLCNNGEEIIMSNGSHKISFRNPNDFSVIREIEVYDNNGPIGNLNELEYIDGKIYANVYLSDRLVIIDPESGNVEAFIDADMLAFDYRSGGEALNGIAYNKENGKIFMTGKNWPSLLEVKFEEKL